MIVGKADTSYGEFGQPDQDGRLQNHIYLCIRRPKMLKKHWKLAGLTAIVVAGLALCVGAVAVKQIQEKNFSILFLPVLMAIRIGIYSSYFIGAKIPATHPKQD